MNKYVSFSIYFLMLQSTPTFTNFYSSQQVMTSSSVIINGKKFTHTKKSDNGVFLQQFFINDVPVEQDEFNNEMNSLKLAHMNLQEKEHQRKIDDHENMKNNLKTTMLAKLITQSLQELQESLSILHESVLKPYLVFHQNTIHSATQLDQLVLWTNSLEKGLKQFLSDQNIATLQKLSQEIENKLEMARSCLKQSMQQATTHCDDTATLKKLLNLIES